MSVTVSGSFSDGHQLRVAVARLIEAHFESEQLRIVVTTGDGQREVPVRHQMQMTRGALVGGGFGIVVGGLVAAWLAAGAGQPGNVGLLSGSVTIAVLQGVFAGAMLGSLMGLIVGMAIWRTTVDIAPSDFEAGEVRVCARTGGPGVDRVRRLLDRSGASRVSVQDVARG